MNQSQTIAFLAACAHQFRHVDAEAVRHDPEMRQKMLRMARAYESRVRAYARAAERDMAA